MRIEVDVLGVEQAVDFNTMATAAFVIIEVLGETVRVPISEEQMARLTVAAVNEHTGVESSESQFEETRETMPKGVKVSTERGSDAPLREFSVMSGLSPENDEPGGIAGIFAPDSEDEKVTALRNRPGLRGRAPAPEQEEEHEEPRNNLPSMPGFGQAGDEGGFQQG